jgi:hypothetical protein
MEHLALALLLAGPLAAQVTRTILCDPTAPTLVEQYESANVRLGAASAGETATLPGI